MDKKAFKIVGSTLVLLVIAVAIIIYFNQLVPRVHVADNSGAPLQIPIQSETLCPIRSQQFTVNGESMAPFIKSGEIIQGLLGYYNCHAIQRGDVVLVYYAGDAYPLVKFVRGVPGDSFSLEQIQNVYTLKINGEVVDNSEKIPYRINDSGYRMLSLYADNYHNTIPANAYLILGDNPDGSLDSERFGLVGKLDIVGKAVILH